MRVAVTGACGSLGHAVISLLHDRGFDAPFEGHESLYITSADTTSELATDTLLELFFPRVPRRAPAPDAVPPPGRWSLLSGVRAREVLGYRPEYHWPEILAAQTAAGDAAP